ncbi:Probable lactoylglutathione lyase, chloroplastic [Linum perenne]
MSITLSMPLSLSSSYYSGFTFSANKLPFLRRPRYLNPPSCSSSSSMSEDAGCNAATLSRRLALFQLSSTISQSYLSGLRKASSLSNVADAMGSVSFVKKALAERTPDVDLKLLNWVKNDKRRMLHVVYYVGDLDKTIKFYTECLGMKLLRQRDIPEDRYRNAFLGYGPEESNFAVELTYNYGVDKYDIGSGFGHFGIAVEDVEKAVSLVNAKSGKITREPGPANGGSTKVAFLKDPDGYNFELLERKPAPEPLCQVMLRVGDLDRSIDFYKKAFGMDLLHKRDNANEKSTVAFMGYGPEDKNVVLGLTYNFGISSYEKGNGYQQIAIGTDDVYKSAEAIRQSDGTIVREPGPLPVINTKITVCLDPDGWKWVFVDNADFLRELE